MHFVAKSGQRLKDSGYCQVIVSAKSSDNPRQASRLQMLLRKAHLVLGPSVLGVAQHGVWTQIPGKIQQEEPPKCRNLQYPVHSYALGGSAS